MGRIAVGEERKSEVLRVRVTNAKKLAFIAKAKAHGKNETELLSWLVDEVLKQDGQIVAGSNADGDTEARSEKLHIRVNEKMKNDVKARAKEAGERSSSSYLHTMLKAHLSKEASFTEKELNELRLGRNELTTLGRNISQIAKVLNTAPENVHLVKGMALGEVAEAIKSYRDSVGRLIRANLAAWGVEYHDERI